MAQERGTPWVRPPAVAGGYYPAMYPGFYPGQPSALVEQVRQYLDQGLEHLRARHGEQPLPLPKAIIAPHAGYVYSGPIAGTAYARLLRAGPAARQITRVVLIGPAHFVPFQGVAASTAQAFATPLGQVSLDQAGVDRALTLPFVRFLDAAHQREHSLEVHLPFLQVALSGAQARADNPAGFALVPLAVRDASAAEVAQLLETLWGGPETLVVVSSDLSHYHDYAAAQSLDRATSAAIEALRPDELHEERACGWLGIQGLLAVAPKHGLRPTTVDLRNSGDTAGPRDRVVGYGAYVFA